MSFRLWRVRSFNKLTLLQRLHFIISISKVVIRLPLSALDNAFVYEKMYSLSYFHYLCLKRTTWSLCKSLIWFSFNRVIKTYTICKSIDLTIYDQSYYHPSLHVNFLHLIVCIFTKRNYTLSGSNGKHILLHLLYSNHSCPN